MTQVDDHICLGPGCKCHIKGIIKEKKPPRTKQLRNNSKAQERHIAKLFKTAGFEQSRRVPGSGSMAILPGDIDSDWFLGEAKMTRTGRMVIVPLWIRKIRKQAQQMGKRWWVLHTWTAEGNDQFEKLVTLDESTFFEILAQAKANE